MEGLSGSQYDLHIHDQDNNNTKDTKHHVEYIPDPPDGGYGWVVALSSGILSFFGMR